MMLVIVMIVNDSNYVDGCVMLSLVMVVVMIGGLLVMMVIE